MGKLRQINVANVVITEYGEWSGSYKPPIHRVNSQLNKEDTYIAIFSLYQETHLKVLRGSKQVRILYESPRAYNFNMGAREPRNKVVVFELVDDEKSS